MNNEYDKVKYVNILKEIIHIKEHCLLNLFDFPFTNYYNKTIDNSHKIFS